MTTLLMAERSPDDEDAYLPRHFADIANRPSTRKLDVWVLISSDQPIEVIKQRCDTYSKRTVIGAQAIWQEFPELRGDFVGEIQRYIKDRKAYTAMLPLSLTIADDVLLRLQLTLHIADYVLVEFSRLSGSTERFDSESFFITRELLGVYGHLLQPITWNFCSILNKHLFFCEGISLLSTHGDEIVSGIRFYGPKGIYEATDIDEQLTKASGPPHRFEISLPQQFSGVFVIDQAEKRYPDALANRLIAAAALAGGVGGNIIARLSIGESFLHYDAMPRSATARPYLKQFPYAPFFIGVDNEQFAQVLKLLATTNFDKFIKAKEDFRLLALDTIEDARSDAPALQYAQIWMAIERLLSFDRENAVSLALALSAFSPVAERREKFRELKKAYDLRSKIAHGYSFRRDTEMAVETDKMAQLFRSAFHAALPIPDPVTKVPSKLEAGTYFPAALTDHVLEGKPEPWIYRSTESQALPAVL